MSPSRFPYIDANMAREADYHLSASHIIAPKGRGIVPGYIVAAAYGDVEVLKQTSPPCQYRRIENYRDLSGRALTIILSRECIRLFQV